MYIYFLQGHQVRSLRPDNVSNGIDVNHPGFRGRVAMVQVVVHYAQCLFDGLLFNENGSGSKQPEGDSPKRSYNK
jgi:hypothetical protein